MNSYFDFDDIEDEPDDYARDPLPSPPARSRSLYASTHARTFSPPPSTGGSAPTHSISAVRPFAEPIAAQSSAMRYNDSANFTAAPYSGQAPAPALTSVPAAPAVVTASDRWNQSTSALHERGAAMASQLGAFASALPPAFNDMQQQCFNVTFHSRDAVVFSAPTGAGKTVVFECAMVKEWLEADAQGRARPCVVYVAPIRALCRQRFDEWTARLSPLGIDVREITGDESAGASSASSSHWSAVRRAHVLCVTPEKFDALTRNCKDRALLGRISLLCIDECHLLGDTRGAALEALVSRIKAFSQSPSLNGTELARVRYMAASATIPNIDSVAQWIGASPTTGTLVFGDNYRPVPLHTVVVGVSEGKNDFLFDRNLAYRLLGCVREHASGRPALVFCATRKGAANAASIVCKQLDDQYGNSGAAAFVHSDAQRNALQDAASRCNDRALAAVLPKGVAFHNAGLSRTDRAMVEQLFEQRQVAVLCTTRTLAQGVNLPCHLVVVMNTSFWNDRLKRNVPYSAIDVLQMIGRAGRPQFDSSAKAVILTPYGQVQRWQSLVSGSQPLESHLRERFAEHLNAEVCNGAIASVSDAIDWLRSTFLFVRLRQNPSHYGLPRGLNAHALQSSLSEICVGELRRLAAEQMIVYDDDGFGVSGTPVGRMMSKHSIAFETVVLFKRLLAQATLSDVLAVVVQSSELANSVLRRAEKRELNRLAKLVRFPVHGKVKTKHEKLSVLLQSHLGGVEVLEYGLRQEVAHFGGALERVVRCLIEYALFHRWFGALVAAVDLHKCLRRTMWETSERVTRQIDGIGDALSKALAGAGIVTLRALQATDPRRIEAIVNRRVGFGNTVLEAVAQIPQYDVRVARHVLPSMAIELLVSLEYREPPAVGESSFTTSSGQQMLMPSSSSMMMTTTTTTTTAAAAAGARGGRKARGRYDSSMVVVGDMQNNVLFVHRFLDSAAASRMGEQHRVPLPRDCARVQVYVVSCDWIGVDQRREYVVRDGALLTPNESVQLEAAADLSGECARQEAASAGASRRNKRQLTDSIATSTTTTTTAAAAAAAAANGELMSCAHTCADKQACKHQCCKTGVRATRKRKLAAAAAAASSATATTSSTAPASSAAWQQERARFSRMLEDTHDPDGGEVNTNEVYDDDDDDDVPLSLLRKKASSLPATTHTRIAADAAGGNAFSRSSTSTQPNLSEQFAQSKALQQQPPPPPPPAAPSVAKERITAPKRSINGGNGGLRTAGGSVFESAFDGLF